MLVLRLTDRYCFTSAARHFARPAAHLLVIVD
jgi:hypothetical protein